MKLTPLYTWAGGKTRLLKHYAPIFPNMEDFSHYVEPFFGGGAVFGSLVDSFKGKSFVNDSNAELVGVLRAVKNDPAPFLEESRELVDRVLAFPSKEERKAAYYKELNLYWENPTPGKVYALMKLGFNGIWQTNKKSKGLFATPAGLLNRNSSYDLIKTELIYSWHKALQETAVFSGDYRDVEFPKEKTLIYLDPPYRDSFTTYSTGFNDSDQRQVVSFMKSCAAEGATVLLANRHVDDDPFFEDLLPEASFHYFDVTYTAGRRKRVESGFEAKPAREFLAILKP